MPAGIPPHPIPSWLRAPAARARRVLRGVPGLAAAYIFGSSLTRRDFRDVDIALLMAPRATGPSDSRLNRLAVDLDGAFRAETDLHLCGRLPDPLLYRVVCEGARLATLDRLAAVRFETDTLIRFLDFKPAHDWLADRVLERPGPW
jgi:hypothetical protein